ncbi:MAG TPA: type II toxin-antitoxin system VapC family toxin [Gaiellaceae bacterium]|nr:type II toxin-antitoxin system VapC family toxin [Gaiellaceae bacterium]
MRTASDVAYFDASALHKLVVTEHETDALKQGARAWPRRATSRLTVVELVRSVRRADPALEPAARRLIGGVTLVADSNRVLLDAAQLEPQTLRTLDAIHVATAYRIRSVLAAFVSYDARQLAAAEALGLPVASPR